MTETINAELAGIAAVSDPPRIPFGTKAIATQTMPFEWGQWIFTGMRAAELVGEKPKPFSWWLTEASHHFIIHTAMDDK